MLTTFLATLFHRFHVPSQAERELAYLNGAANRYDLEYRERQIDRGLFGPKAI